MTTSLLKALAQQSAMEAAESRRAGDGDVPDAVMLKRKPNPHLFWPDWDEIPEGALESDGIKVPSVLPYVKVGKEIYGRHTAVEVGVTGEF